MNLIGISYKQAPIEIREKLVLVKQEQILLLQKLTKKFPISEIFVLSTCNRTEIYYYTKKRAKKIIPQEVFLEILNFKELSIKNLPLVEKEKEQAYRHFFRVACGMESMVLGETQILKQVKESMLTAKEQNLFGTQLEFLFQRMFYITKKVRSETKISANAISIGSTAVKLTKTIFDNLSKKKVMVIGAGEVAELILQHLIDNKVSDIIITNRTFANALRLAKKFASSAVLYEDRYKYLAEVDIIISSTYASDFVLKKSLCQNLLEKKSPTFLIDIAVPRDIEPDIEKLANCYLYHIDDLEEVIFSNYSLREKESKKANFILEEEIEYFLQHLKWKKKNFFIKSLKTKYEKMVKKELEFFFSKHLHLKKEEAAIENLVYRIQQKFLHNPYLFFKNKSIKGSKEIFCNIFGISYFQDEEKKKTNNIIQFKRKIMSRKFRVPVPPKPKQKYAILIPKQNISLEVNPAKIPYDRHGIPGSVLERVCADKEDLIEHACGGVQACSTCHIYVTKGLETCPEASEREEDYLDKARGVKTNSRLACCVVPNGNKDIEIEIPTWNVNLVKEGH